MVHGRLGLKASDLMVLEGLTLYPIPSALNPKPLFRFLGYRALS